MTRKRSVIVGWFYIAVGLLVNPWFLARVVAADGRIDSAWTIGAICVLEVLLVSLGVLTISLSHRAWVVNLNLLLCTLVITVPVLGEVAFRTGIALEIHAFRRPHLYANYFVDDDFWLLEQRWVGGRRYASPGRVHELLGWSQAHVTSSNPLGLDAETLSRMASAAPKILFFGDSYVRGEADPEFQLPQYLNDRLSGVDVVDVSVGGYGLDQIYLMFQEIQKANSLILIGILADDDLDRTVLTVRTSQKPYYLVDDNAELRLGGVPIQRDQATYFQNSSLRLKSFILAFLNQRLVGSDLKVSLKQRIGSALLSQFITDAQDENSGLAFVIFYSKSGLQTASWQESFLLTTLSRSNARVIDTKPHLLKYLAESGATIPSLYTPGGHHNNAGNRVIGDAILEYLKQMGAEATGRLW